MFMFLRPIIALLACVLAVQGYCQLTRPSFRHDTSISSLVNGVRSTGTTFSVYIIGSMAIAVSEAPKWWNYMNINKLIINCLYIDRLLQKRHNSIAKALELHLSCSKPSIYCILKVFEVQRPSDRIILLKLIIGKTVYTLVNVYAPQQGRPEAEKDRFYDQLNAVVAKIPLSEVLIPGGDWNGHVGRAADGFEEVHGGYGYGVRNDEGGRLLDFAVAHDLVIGNTLPWELFFADDLVIIATSLEECVERVKVWKEGLESKGLHVNMTKTKFMASGLGLDILQDSGKFPCAVCRTGVGRSSIRCSKCNLWVHYKKCSGLKTLSEDLSYECPRCRGVPGIRPVDGRPFKEVEVGDCVLEAVDRFCYLGDMLSAGGGCMAAATARCRCAWGRFRENLPLLTSKPVPFDLRGRLFSSNVRSSMLHGTETWPMTSAALHRLCRNDRAMIRWICGVKPSDDPSMDELHAKLGICDLAILVRERRLRWFGHVMRSNGEINRVRSRPVPGRKGPGRPKKTWEECVKQDLKVCGLSEAGTQDRLSWRSSVKNSRQEPIPSNGSLLQSMAAPPARRVLGMRTRSFNKTGFDWLIDWLMIFRSRVLSFGSWFIELFRVCYSTQVGSRYSCAQSIL